MPPNGASNLTDWSISSPDKEYTVQCAYMLQVTNCTPLNNNNTQVELN